MFLASRHLCIFCTCLPHGRGDVSTRIATQLSNRESSPRAWGCFLAYLFEGDDYAVFPTGVGMFLCEKALKKRVLCLPHGRGDVSNGL